MTRRSSGTVTLLDVAHEAGVSVATVSKVLNGRADVAQLNAGLQTELAGKGMTFNQPGIDAFRDKLRRAGFYSEWKGKFGDEAWALLERSTGKLA